MHPYIYFMQYKSRYFQNFQGIVVTYKYLFLLDKDSLTLTNMKTQIRDKMEFMTLISTLVTM